MDLTSLAAVCLLALGYQSTDLEDVPPADAIFFRDVDSIAVPNDTVVVVYRSITHQDLTRGIGVRERRIHVYIKDSETSTVMHIGSEDRINAAIAGWLMAINSGEDSDAEREEVLSLGHELRKLLLGGVLSKIGEQRKLYVHPGSIVEAVPLDALPLENGLVGDKYTISIWPLLQVPPADAFATDDMAVGEPCLFLLGVTKKEVGFIEEAFVENHQEGVKTAFVDLSQAEPKNLVSGLKSSYVHLAMPPERYAWPGKITDNWGKGVLFFGVWDFTGIQLGSEASDKEWLSSKSILEMDLAGCRLAFLQGAETRGGIYLPGPGRCSIGSALLMACVRATITSLWQTKPEPAEALIRSFYFNLWNNKQPVPYALWNAKREMRDNGHPLVDWAGWVYAGAL